MSYTVTITRNVEDERPQTQWKQVRSADLARELGKNEWEYVEGVLPFVAHEKVYEQTVDDIDVFAVIEAVNGEACDAS